MNDAAGLRYRDLLIDPAASGLRRVVAENGDPVLVFAPEQRLEQVPDICHTAELVDLLKPCVFQVSPADVDTLRLQRVVGTFEQDLLTRRFDDDLHRRILEPEQIRYTEFFNTPDELPEHGIPELVGIPTEHHGVGVRIVYQTEQDLNARKRAFSAATTAP